MAMAIPSTRPIRDVTAVDRSVLVNLGHQRGRCRSMVTASLGWLRVKTGLALDAGYRWLTSAPTLDVSDPKASVIPRRF
jgi:hypothetical protein